MYSALMHYTSLKSLTNLTDSNQKQSAFDNLTPI